MMLGILFSFNKAQMKPSNKWLYLIIFIGLVFRFFYPFFSNPFGHLYSDPHRHHYNVTEDHFGTALFSILDPPLPQLILKTALFIFGDTVFGAATYLGLLCAITPWCWYKWGREIFPSKTTALIFMAVITYLPSWISIYSYFMDEPILLPLLGISLWLSWRAKRKGTISSLLLATVLWALTASVKLNTAFELVLVLSWLIFCLWKQNRRKALLASIVVACIVGMTYLTYPLWVYKGLGFTWLFPPGMGALNRGWHRSNGVEYTTTIIYKGKTLYQTGSFGSNATCSEPFAPFSNWSTWRHGLFKYTINCDKPVNLTLEPYPLALKDHLRNMLEETLHLLFSQSWPDCREDDPIQQAQRLMRWAWSVLTLAIIILAVRKKAMNNVLVILCLATLAAYVLSDSSMLDGRYRKPWEGIAIATLIYLYCTNKSKRKTNEGCFG